MGSILRFRNHVPLLALIGSLTFLVVAVLVWAAVRHANSTSSARTVVKDEIEQNIQVAKDKRAPADERSSAFRMLALSKDPLVTDTRVTLALAALMVDRSFPMRASAAHHYWMVRESQGRSSNRLSLAPLMDECAPVWGSVVGDETQGAGERNAAARGIRFAMHCAMFTWSVGSCGAEEKADAKEALRIGLVKAVFPVRQLIEDQSESWMKKKWATPEVENEFHVECLDLIIYLMTEMKDDPELQSMAKSLRAG